ncbi:MAG TPA: hypothetical protein VJ818_02580, partial [Actinomycetota bacterium]|nr:hypothetical protein [Actinomycetota bacterium]
ALVPGRRALRASLSAGAERHVAKSRLFLGVALADAGSRAAARRELVGALRAAQRCGASQVARVARVVLDEKGLQAAG